MSSRGVVFCFVLFLLFGGQMKQYFTDVSPAKSLAGVATFLEDRRDAARKQLMLTATSSPAYEPLAKLVELLEEQLGVFQAQKQTVAGFEKVGGRKAQRQGLGEWTT